MKVISASFSRAVFHVFCFFSVIVPSSLAKVVWLRRRLFCLNYVILPCTVSLRRNLFVRNLYFFCLSAVNISEEVTFDSQTDVIYFCLPLLLSKKNDEEHF